MISIAINFWTSLLLIITRLVFIFSGANKYRIALYGKCKSEVFFIMLTGNNQLMTLYTSKNVLDFLLHTVQHHFEKSLTALSLFVFASSLTEKHQKWKTWSSFALYNTAAEHYIKKLALH